MKILLTTVLLVTCQAGRPIVPLSYKITCADSGWPERYKGTFSLAPEGPEWQQGRLRGDGIYANKWAVVGSRAVYISQDKKSCIQVDRYNDGRRATCKLGSKLFEDGRFRAQQPNCYGAKKTPEWKFEPSEATNGASMELVDSLSSERDEYSDMDWAGLQGTVPVEIKNQSNQWIKINEPIKILEDPLRRDGYVKVQFLSDGTWDNEKKKNIFLAAFPQLTITASKDETKIGNKTKEESPGPAPARKAARENFAKRTAAAQAQQDVRIIKAPILDPIKGMIKEVGHAAKTLINLPRSSAKKVKKVKEGVKDVSKSLINPVGEIGRGFAGGIKPLCRNAHKYRY